MSGFQFQFLSPCRRGSFGCRAGRGNCASKLGRCQVSKRAFISFHLPPKLRLAGKPFVCLDAAACPRNKRTNLKKRLCASDKNRRRGREHSVGKMQRIFRCRLHTRCSFDHLFGCHQMTRLHLLWASLCGRIPCKACQLFDCKTRSPSRAFFQASSVRHVTLNCVWCVRGTLLKRNANLVDMRRDNQPHR